MRVFFRSPNPKHGTAGGWFVACTTPNCKWTPQLVRVADHLQHARELHSAHLEEAHGEAAA